MNTKSFPHTRSNLIKPKFTDSARQYFDFYAGRVSLSENQVASLSRINQSRLNNVLNGKIKTIDVESLVKICMVLKLSQMESEDFLSRFERAFSPANRVHKFYRNIILLYSTSKISPTDFHNNPENKPEFYLNEADDYLMENGMPTLSYAKERKRPCDNHKNKFNI